jgi:hypothetical protein
MCVYRSNNGYHAHRLFQLYTGGPSPPEFLGRISRENGAVRLDMTTYAIQLGLLDATVVAALLLQCGRNID